MTLSIYIVNAFTKGPFSGNPAAICPLENWISDDQMQLIATQNNLSETAFIVKDNDQFIIRWFTPSTEVDLCGHATLAAADIVFNHLQYTEDIIRFYSPRSGSLPVSKNDGQLVLDFPADPVNEIPFNEAWSNGFNIQPVRTYKGKSYHLFEFNDQEDIERLVPNIEEIRKWDTKAIVATARGKYVDFVSRFFAPALGVDEDPVTGSAHCLLTPFWSERLNKSALSALQLSARKGFLNCRLTNDRVLLSGYCSLYLEGKIYL
jgi:PhzF family phenazine biosynthesis protein